MTNPYGEDAPLAEVSTMAINRRWENLEAPTGPDQYRRALRQAGEKLGDWPIHLAGVRFSGPRLVELAEEARDEPILRVVREGLRRPIDLLDFLYFLDDVLTADGLRGRLLWITSGRARKSGILLHPDDIFKKGRPRVYGQGRSELRHTMRK